MTNGSKDLITRLQNTGHLKNSDEEIMQETIPVASITDPKLRGRLYDMAESYEGQDLKYS